MFESKCNDFRMQKLIVFCLMNIKSYDHSEFHGKKHSYFRPHEFGGKYGQGITVRRYETGSKILIRVELTGK